MKKILSSLFVTIFLASALAMSTFAASVDDVVQVNVIDGLCTLIDNPATNHQASNYALCFAEAYGTGRSTEDDAVIWEDVTFENDVKQIAVKCGYNLGGDKAGTGTEFWLYLNKIEGAPIAKVAVNDSETASSQIRDQVYKFANVNIKAGTYNVIVVSKTEYSGSVSQINFMYKPMDAETLAPIADAKRAEDIKKSQGLLMAELEAKKAEEEAKKAAEKEAAQKAEEETKRAEEAQIAEEKAEDERDIPIPDYDDDWDDDFEYDWDNDFDDWEDEYEKAPAIPTVVIVILSIICPLFLLLFLFV